MTETDDLGRRLGAALLDEVPDPPAVPDRVDDVVRRSRRTRRRRAAVTVVGAAAAVAVIAGLTALLPSTDQPSDPARTPTADAPVRAECPAVAPRIGNRPESAPNLPPGAAEARLCRGPGFTFQPPADVLATGVDALLDAVEATPPRRGTICTGDLGIGFSIVLAYPDGSERTVTGENYGCGYLVGAGPVRVGASEVWSTYLRLLRAQRASAGQPSAGPDVDASCAGTFGDFSPLGSPLALVRGSLCWSADGAGPPSWSGRELSSEDLQTVLDALRDPANRTRPPRGCPYRPLRLALVGVDAWGDRSVIVQSCGVFSINDKPQNDRVLPPDVQALIDRVVADSR